MRLQRRQPSVSIRCDCAAQSHAAESRVTVISPKKSTSARRHDSLPDVSTLESFVGYNLRRAAAKQRERFRSVFDPFEIRPVQLTVLSLIRDAMPLKQSLLGKALEMKRANVVIVLDELEARGLIERQTPDSDRRAHVLSLTAKGETLTTKLLALHTKLESDLAKSFGAKELAKLVSLLQDFRALDSDPKLR
jgi:DNA-binding MarR family transcriptional regulator